MAVLVLFVFPVLRAAPEARPPQTGPETPTFWGHGSWGRLRENKGRAFAQPRTRQRRGASLSVRRVPLKFGELKSLKQIL